MYIVFTMNEFSNIPAESEFRDEMTMDCREIESELTPEEVTEQQLAREEAFEQETPLGQLYGDGEDNFEPMGRPGDGSGTDDFADLNAAEAMDYLNE